MPDLAWSLHFRQCLESGAQDRQLHCRVFWLTKGTTKGNLDGSDSWCADSCSQIGDVGERDGSKTSRFDFALYQSNGPAAERSSRDQHNRVDPFRLQSCNNCGGAFFQELVRLQVVSHE